MKNTLQTQELILYCILCTMLYVISLFYFFGFWVLGLLCHHNASPSVTPENHTSGVQYEGSPQNPNRIERYSCNGSWDWRHTHTHINKPQRSKTKHTSMNTQNKWTFWSVYFEFFFAPIISGTHRGCAVIGKPGSARLEGTFAIHVTCLYVS